MPFPRRTHESSCLLARVALVCSVVGVARISEGGLTAQSIARTWPSVGIGPGPADLAGTGPSVHVAARELLESRRPTREMLRTLWLAGRAPLPGLSASQAARRQAETEEALEAVRSDLGRWQASLEEGLRAEGDAAWCAAARTVGALELRAFASRLADGLAPGVSERRRHAARAALHQLFAVWLDGPGDVEPFLEGEPSATAAFVERLRVQEERATARALELLALDGSRALELLDDEPPRVRERAAARIARAVTSGELERTRGFDALVARLDLEGDPQAFHALLDAVLLPLEGVGASETELESLFALFERRASRPWDSRSLSVAQALSRLAFELSHRRAERDGDPREADDPRAEEAAGAGQAAYLSRALQLIGDVLAGGLRADEERGFEDSDAIAGVLGALTAVAGQVHADEGARVVRSQETRAALLAILRDVARADATRQAAAAAFGSFVGSDDLGLLRGELERDDLPVGLALVLLRTLGERLTTRPDADDADVLAAMRRVVATCGAGDPDLRRSALELIADTRLAPLVERLEPDFLLDLLQGEEVVELRRTLVSLLRRFGGPELFPELLAMEGFDGLAAESGAFAGEFDAMLLTLADREPTRIVQAARRLGDGGDAQRLRRALDLVGTLEDDAARQLAPDQEDDVVRWAWSLYERGYALREVLDEALVARFSRLHLDVGRLESETIAKRHHLRAVLADWDGLAQAEPGAVATIEAHLTDALAAAEAVPSGAGGALEANAGLLRLLRRDRARFAAAVGRFEEAFDAYRGLVQTANEKLEVSDVRAACRAALEGEAAPDRMRFGADLLYGLVHSEPWAAEPPTVRVADVRRLQRLVEGTGDHTALERFVALFEDLPAPEVGGVDGGSTASEEETDDPQAKGGPWRGLAEDLEALRALREVSNAARAALAASGGTGGTGDAG